MSRYNAEVVKVDVPARMSYHSVTLDMGVGLAQ